MPEKIYQWLVSQALYGRFAPAMFRLWTFHPRTFCAPDFSTLPKRFAPWVLRLLGRCTQGRFPVLGRFTPMDSLPLCYVCCPHV